MPKPERGSLSMVKRALPNLPPAVQPEELEKRLLGAEEHAAPEAVFTAAGPAMALEPTEVQPAVQPEVLQAIQPADVHTVDVPLAAAAPATRLTPRPGKRKEPVQMVTYRIPASLYDRLFRVAEYNNLNMTDIVVEAIERHLPNFPKPR